MPEESKVERIAVSQLPDIEGLPEIYANGFNINMGTGDIEIILKRRDEPIAVLQMSYTIAKTLAQGLAILIGELEQRTGNEIMTTQFIKDKLESSTSNEL